MDLQAIADALAGRFVGITATNGTDTETVTGTANLPDTIATLALLVWPPTATLDIGTSARRNDLYTFRITLLRDPLSTPARTRWLYSWFNAIHDRVSLDMDLGLGSYVSIAEPTGLPQMAIDGLQYSSADGTFKPFDVVELSVDVRVNEHVTIGV